MKRNSSQIQKVEKFKVIEEIDKDNTVEINATPDLSYRNHTAANKYMRVLNIQDGRLEGECRVAANIAKMNVDLIKVESDEIRSGMFLSPKYSFSEVTWKGDYISNPLYRETKLPLESLNINDSIRFLLPKDPSIFFYDYTNNAEHDFRRSFLINDAEFSPFSRMPVFSFCPIFTSDPITSKERRWYTFGLKQKYILIHDIQQNVKDYTIEMFSNWFSSEFTTDVKFNLNKYGLSKFISDYVEKDPECIARFKKVNGKDEEFHPLSTDSYTKDHQQKFLYIVLNSTSLHWYMSPLTNPFDKIKYYLNEQYKDDKRFISLIDGDDEMSDYEQDTLVYVVNTYFGIGRIVQVLKDSLFKRDLNETEMEQLKFLAYLWSFQNNLCYTFTKFVKLMEDSFSNYEQPDINTLISAEGTFGNQEALHEATGINFDDDNDGNDGNGNNDGNDGDDNVIDDNGDINVEQYVVIVPDLKLGKKEMVINSSSSLKVAIKKIFKKTRLDNLLESSLTEFSRLMAKFEPLFKQYSSICEVALRSRYLTENYFNKTYTIHHKFLKLTPSISDFVFIKYNGKNATEENNREETNNLYKSDLGEIISVEKEKPKAKDPIKGKSIVFKYSIFTIILYNAERGESRTNSISKEGSRKDKSDLVFEKVIVLWGKNFIEFSNTEGDNKVWYEAYHTYGQGQVKGVDADSSCVMIRFKPDMNISSKYEYEDVDVANEIKYIHSLFHFTFYIMDYYFDDLDISFIPVALEGKNLIVADIGEGINIVESLTKEEKEVEVNNKTVKRNVYNLALQCSYAMDGDTRTGYCMYKDGALKYNSKVMERPKYNTRESRALKYIKDCLIDEGDHSNIVQDDLFNQITGGMFDDIHKDDSENMDQEKTDN